MQLSDVPTHHQLEKYGYLQCQVQSRHKRSFFPDFSEGGAKYGALLEGSLPPCTNREVRKAIKQYQKQYHLPETGVVDRRTKRLMSTSRCGNSDKDEDLVGEDSLQVTEATDRTSTSELLHTFVKQSSDSISNKGSNGPSLSDHFKSQPWKRSASNTNSMLNVISGSLRSRRDASTSSLERRKRYLHDYVNRLKLEDPMLFKPEIEGDSDSKIIQIKKRSVAVTEHIEKSQASALQSSRFAEDGQKFEKQVIKWRLLESGYSTRIPVEEQRSTLDLAFRMWSEVIPLNFLEVTDGDIASVDIEVAFGTGSHQNCKRDFDGHGGEIAHSFSTGNMHFDDDEFFQTMNAHSTDGIYLLRVAVHEIGHVLGLLHTDKKYSIMYAIYEKEHSGVCKGKFNTVFDWVRRNDRGKYIFNTYFFRQQYYWMYENHANRTRYGDPLPITNEWRGVPDEPDGYAHVLIITVDNNIVDDAYFFKDEDVYKYDNANDRLTEGWPRKIRDVFPAKVGGEPIPNNLDSAFFDIRDKNLFFFKNDLVYVYDPLEAEDTRGCCVRKRKLQEEFPAVEGSEPLPDNLDAVYYSHVNESMYFIKGEDVWQNVHFHVRQIHISNGVKYIGKWYEKWFDICDVTTHSTHVFDFKKNS
ncbi:MMP21-like protein [Mya arenaria]|uniref:MMP21-like protein n=1 Tax=Mya arenaria TaxID=6604 RepID=A0ABY7FLB1_MYAAR|nr:MMP21-like protein [Mya arenaria]